jgi:hypothetical protein
MYQSCLVSNAQFDQHILDGTFLILNLGGWWFDYMLCCCYKLRLQVLANYTFVILSCIRLCKKCGNTLISLMNDQQVFNLMRELFISGWKGKGVKKR